MEQLHQQAYEALSQTLERAILHTGKALVIFDDEAELTKIITEGYRIALPDAKFLDIEGLNKEDISVEFEKLSPGDLVVLVQSSNFRLDDFRIRIFLFRMGLKTIEHTHLGRMPQDQWGTYIEALKYDPLFFHRLGQSVLGKLEEGKRTEVKCKDLSLVYDVPFEEPKLNIGDYRNTKNVGGTFPIGEIFTESTELSRVNGSALIFAFAGMDHVVRTYEPFEVIVKDGILSAGKDAPNEFLEIIALIKETESVYVREFGLGMNPAIRKGRLLDDITACERMTGLHLSLGGKHSIFKKPGFNKKHGRYHIDVFVDADQILVDGEVIFEGGEYVV